MTAQTFWGRVSPSDGRVPAAPRNVRETVLLPRPRDRDRVPARPRKFARRCSSSVSGIMANHNTRLAPGFTPRDRVPAPANVVFLWGLPRWPHGLYQMPSSRGTASPVWPEDPRTPLCSWGFVLPTRAPPGISCGVSASVLPLFIEY